MEKRGGTGGFVPNFGTNTRRASEFPTSKGKRALLLAAPWIVLPREP
jgi:hypothetical protein